MKLLEALSGLTSQLLESKDGAASLALLWLLLIDEALLRSCDRVFSLVLDDLDRNLHVHALVGKCHCDKEWGSVEAGDAVDSDNLLGLI